jgi:hypothetical protein
MYMPFVTHCAVSYSTTNALLPPSCRTRIHEAHRHRHMCLLQPTRNEQEPAGPAGWVVHRKQHDLSWHAHSIAMSAHLPLHPR